MSGARALIHLDGPVTRGTSIPAEVLARTVEGFQKAVWLVAAAAQERQLRSRFKPSAALRRQFTLKVEITEKGGYVIPAVLSDDSMPLTSGAPNPLGADVLDTLMGVWKSVGANDHAQLEALLPNEEYRQKILSEMKNVLPRREDGWTVGFGRSRSDEVMLDYKSRAAVEHWIQGGDEHEESTVVIGRLLKIDFVKSAAILLYRPTHRAISCYYLAEAEDDILDGRKGLFQATGKFVLDAAGHPREVLDVRRFEPVNLAPAEFSRLEVGGQVFFFDPPLVVRPELDPDTEQWFMASLPDFHIEASGKTRDALFEDVADQIRFVWNTYALANDDSLAEDAILLKQRVIQRVSEGDA